MRYSEQKMNMKRISVQSILLIGFLLISTSTIFAQQIGRWEKLGQRSVNLYVDRDVIDCSNKGRFKAIKFHVMKAPVSFQKVYVKYANGASDNLKFSELVRAGSDSGELDLRGNQRTIKEIVVYYKTEKKQPRGNKVLRKEAVVQVWGKH